MKSELSRVLKKDFRKKMSVGLSNFQKVGTAFGGDIYRKRDEARGLFIFIFLSPDTKYDRFTIELAASTASDFPFDILPGEDAPTGAVRRRIRAFLEGKTDGWWRANESDQLMDFNDFVSLQTRAKVDEATAKMPQLVNDAFQQLQSVLPKFLVTIPQPRML